MASDERRVMHRTRRIETLGLSTRIVMQRAFGPSPLVAICNVLLLRNVIFLDLLGVEVSQDDLLNLVGQGVMHYNRGFQGETGEHGRSREQNISVALIMLHNLAKKFDVDVRFRKISDFEFISEFEIFNLLDIRLYHGWIVDPQDFDTVAVIGSKSHRTLMNEHIAFLSTKSDVKDKSKFQGNSHNVDSSDATRVVSPNLAKGSDPYESPQPSSVKQRKRGDEEEEEEVKQALMLSQALRHSLDTMYPDWSYSSSEESTESHSSGSEVDDDSVSVSSGSESGNSQKFELSTQLACTTSNNCKEQAKNLLNDHKPNYGVHEEFPSSNDTMEKVKTDVNQDLAVSFQPRDRDTNSEDEISKEQTRGTSSLDSAWKTIKDFLNCESQLTVYGLDSLKAGIQEGELCVFFCDDHFSTMLKFKGELYILTTNESYINKPGFVWGKLNKVNGETVPMTGKFKEASDENQENSSLLEGSDISSDFQLALTLQGVEYEEHPNTINLTSCNNHLLSVSNGRGYQCPRTSVISLPLQTP